ncbi:hypothetical protein [Rahnella]|uniref:hypothetical protein n=1 Tax=Rahnella TaxID=34037 RepID=UPI00103F7F73|nr:hypothetical protein [Rahnella]TBX37045.1 hypothetical protein EYY67_02640 [Rahnella victoriana]TDS88029.1 hypothetical protein EDF78_11237 [Rahnella sp. BIGb0236]
MKPSLKINQAVYSDLEMLTRFWCFKRKAIADAVSQSVAEFEKNVADKITELTLNHQDQLAHKDNEYHEQLDNLTRHHQDELTQQKQILMAKISKLETNNDEQRQHNESLTDKLQSLNETVISTEALLSKNRDHMQVLEEIKHELDESHQQLQQDYSQLHQDNLSLSERFTLVQSILSARPLRNAGLDEFRDILNTDYATFAAEESSLADEAGALIALQKILAELEHVNTFPAASGKTVVGVAGGFSSGKSEFINSFIMDKSIKLATGLNPVTIIPSFIVCAPYSRICGYSNNGGGIILNNKTYTALSHDYVSAFGFDLRSIMPTISLQAPMDETLFENVCLVDTPGYNPGAGELAEGADHNNTVKYLEQCTAMIWVIGLDPAGTISQSDLDFISRQSFTAENVYIVLNKADVKSLEDIESIMETVTDQLMFSGVGYAGMTAYSSTRKATYATDGITLEEFLKTQNKRHNITSGFEDKIDTVFKLYGKALRNDIEHIHLLRVRIKDLQLKTLVDAGAKAVKDIQHVTDFFSQELGAENQLKQSLEQSEKLSAMFRAAARRAIAVIQQGETAQGSNP